MEGRRGVDLDNAEKKEERLVIIFNGERKKM
jgi:hypothetical protein